MPGGPVESLAAEQDGPRTGHLHFEGRVQSAWQGSDLGHRQHRRNALGTGWPLHLCQPGQVEHVARMPHLPIAATPADEKTNPVKVSLLGFEVIVFVTKYLAHLLQQALGLGRMGDGVYGINMYETACIDAGKQEAKWGRRPVPGYCKPSRQLIPSDKLGCQNIRRSTSH